MHPLPKTKRFRYGWRMSCQDGGRSPVFRKSTPKPCIGGSPVFRRNTSKTSPGDSPVIRKRKEVAAGSASSHGEARKKIQLDEESSVESDLSSEVNRSNVEARSKRTTGETVIEPLKEEQEYELGKSDISPELDQSEGSKAAVQLPAPESLASTVQFVPLSSLLLLQHSLLSMGCPLLDHALRGGVRRGAITEVALSLVSDLVFVVLLYLLT